MEKITKEALQECQRQLDKWGVQDHHPVIWNSILMEEVGEVSKEVNEFTFSGKIDDLKKMREELIQVIAVGISFVDSLDRNFLKTEGSTIHDIKEVKS